MIWSKTDAGRLEIQGRALVKERAQRNLLLLIDGVRTEEMLLTSLAGITAADFAQLQNLGLIMPSGGTASRVASGANARAPAAPSAAPSSAGPVAAAPPPPVAPVAAPAPAPAADQALDYSRFTEVLTQIISKELGLRGFPLTLAVERAGTIAELQAVAQRTLDELRDRRGEAASAAARRRLYGA